MKTISIILASEVKNLDLANKIKEEVTKSGAEHRVINLMDLNLPLYTSRAEKEHSPQELLSSVLPLIQSTNGFVFIAPEYNGGTPPILTNFIAWLSRSSKNWREHLNGKPAALGTYSGGAGFNVILTMRTQLSYIGMNVVGRAMQFHSQKEINEADIKAVVTELLKIS